MTTATNNKPAAPLFSGKGKASRETAFAAIPSLAYGEETSRAASVDNMRKVLGTAPSDDLVKAARVEYIIGRVAARLPVSELPRGKTSPEQRLAHARDIVLHMARPAEEGKAARKLRAGQIGRRSPAQQRVTRAAEDAASLFMADVMGAADKGMAAKKEREKKAKAKRAPMSGQGKVANPNDGVKASQPWDHSELVKQPATSADDVVTFITAQSRMLTDYINKNAKVAPGDMAQAVQAFRTATLAAANAHQERAAIARAADKGNAPATPAAPAKRQRKTASAK